MCISDIACCNDLKTVKCFVCLFFMFLVSVQANPSLHSTLQVVQRRHAFRYHCLQASVMGCTFKLHVLFFSPLNLFIKKCSLL